MQVDAHRAGAQSRPLGYLGAGHALDEPEHERLAVRLGQRADHLEDSPGFWENNGYHNYGDPWLEQRYWGD